MPDIDQPTADGLSVPTCGGGDPLASLDPQHSIDMPDQATKQRSLRQQRAPNLAIALTGPTFQAGGRLSALQF